MNVLKLDITVEHDQLQKGATEVLKEIKPFWNIEKICFKLFTDGVTNKLIGAYQTGHEDCMVLVRVYGENTDLFIDRNVERESIILLHKVGLGPELYACFNNGLAYEFLPGVTLDDKMCRDPQIFPLICDSTARLHAVDAPISKSIILWDRIDTFLKLLPSSFPEPERQSRFQKEVGTKEELKSIAAELRSVLGTTNYPLVFSHNDLLLANVIYNRAEQTTRFIDFEFAGYNYQPYEVANHFNEYAGIAEVDFNRYPDKAYQLLWIEDYLKKYKRYTGTEESVTDKEVQNFQIMVEKFSLASHFLWGVGAVVQAKECTMDFDFLNYGILRLNEYKKNKDKLWVPLLD